LAPNSEVYVRGAALIAMARAALSYQLAALKKVERLAGLPFRRADFFSRMLRDFLASFVGMSFLFSQSARMDFVAASQACRLQAETTRAHHTSRVVGGKAKRSGPAPVCFGRIAGRSDAT
jgi:hypothetical protein